MKKLSLTIASLMLSTLAGAADIMSEMASPSDKVNAIVISGEIVKGDYEKFIKASSNIANGKPVIVMLDGPGGSLSDAIDIGLLINKRRYHTLAYKGVCASACAYIWLAGERAIIDKDQNAKVGFHSPYYVDKFGNKKSNNLASALLGGYLKDIGANYSMIAFATSVDGDSIKWLTESAAKEIGLSAEFYQKQDNTQNEKIQLAQNEIAKTQGYNRIFNSQLAQLEASGQYGSNDHIRIQKSIAHNNQYIKQQQDIINRLQGR